MLGCIQVLTAQLEGGSTSGEGVQGFTSEPLDPESVGLLEGSIPRWRPSAEHEVNEGGESRDRESERR